MKKIKVWVKLENGLIVKKTMTIDEANKLFGR